MICIPVAFDIGHAPVGGVVCLPYCFVSKSTVLTVAAILPRGSSIAPLVLTPNPRVCRALISAR
jgi:hypothetical protein